MTTYMTQREFVNAKSALTRTVNKYGKTDPQRVVDHVTATFADWDAKRMAYPDNWHNWERARDDALTQIQLNRVW